MGDAKKLKTTIEGYYAPVEDPIAFWEAALGTGDQKEAQAPTDEDESATYGKQPLPAPYGEALSSAEGQKLLQQHPKSFGKGWAEGGCLAIAQLLQTKLGGDLQTVWVEVLDEDSDGAIGTPEHIVLRVGDQLYDARGVWREDQLIQYFLDHFHTEPVNVWLEPFDLKTFKSMGGCVPGSRAQRDLAALIQKFLPESGRARGARTKRT